ncbi:neprilysin-4-like isoform X2 [Hydractinia symbiolongicarpus]|uniref:neprilysin-4-like isoform X2 n=1 Tax=Hydractinia symbiolongicarpus TaxID=13093 RepID=UPI002550C2A7|nr:neprilysin-4-like isoform X2 [Hydractinia symbiolongicarpus]
MVSYVKFSQSRKARAYIIRAVFGFLILLLIAGVSVLVLLYGTKKNENTEKKVAPDHHCNNTLCEVRWHFLSALDKSVNPCDDFYQYACGGWLSKNPIPNGKSEISTISQLQERLFKIEKSILENKENATLDSEAKKNMFRLFESCMDVKGKNKLGTTPMANLIKKLGGFKKVTFDVSDASRTNALMQKVFKEASVSPLFEFTVGPDLKHSTNNIIKFGHPGSAFFEKEDFENKRYGFQNMYERFMLQLVSAFSDGLTVWDSNSIASDLFDFERSLNKILISSKTSNSYNVYPVYNLQISWMNIFFSDFLKSAFNDVDKKIKLDEKVLITNKNYFDQLDFLLSTTSYNTIHNYMLIKVVMHYLDALPDTIVQLFTKLIASIRGPETPPPQWQTCISVTDKHLGLALGAAFVKKAFSEKSHIEMMVNGSSYFDNILYLNRYEAMRTLKKLGEKVDQNTWLQTPATINAYYSPQSNHIAFPAAILQPPYFETDYPKAVNYGCIGSVIGHEMTHGFDNKGRLFDKYGNLRDKDNSWWTLSSILNFVDRSKCFINQYSAVEVAGDYINGQKTLGENIADNGGITIAYRAFKDWEKENGKQPLLQGVAESNDQLFFLSFAQFFCSAKTDKALQSQLKTDVHSPNMERVRETIQNTAEFAKAFNCPLGSRMNPFRKCKLW